MKNSKILARAIQLICVMLAASFAAAAFATTYALPSNGSALIGEPGFTTPTEGETLVGIAHRFDLGLNAIKDANPSLPTTIALPAGTHVAIPSAFLLPPLVREGIVINLAEMRMYYYSSTGIVKTYPIGIGQVGKTIPLTRTRVVRKVKNPVWIPPEDIRAFDEQQGIVLPKIMAAGPDNPLGPYAIYLGIPTYLIHSTIYPDSIGRRASFGCIRMHESDIQDAYQGWLAR
jgi:L,D-transpeptidase ErfK/SrfK